MKSTFTCGGKDV